MGLGFGIAACGSVVTRVWCLCVGIVCKCECCVVFRDSCLCLDQYVSAMGLFFMVVMGCYNRVTGLGFSLFQ